MLFRRRPKTVWSLKLRKGVGMYGEPMWETMWFETEALATKWLKECEPEMGEVDYILYGVTLRGKYDYVFAKGSRGVGHGNT